MRYCKWLANAGIVVGSPDATVEGRNYNRNMKIKKELFCAFMQYKKETLTSKYQEINFELKNVFASLTQDPDSKKNRQYYEK